VEIKDYSEFDGNIHILVEGKSEIAVLGPRITEQIFVEIRY
jgi:hypothetical protein